MWNQIDEDIFIIEFNKKVSSGEATKRDFIDMLNILYKHGDDVSSLKSAVNYNEYKKNMKEYYDSMEITPGEKKGFFENMSSKTLDFRKSVSEKDIDTGSFLNKYKDFMNEKLQHEVYKGDYSDYPVLKTGKFYKDEESTLKDLGQTRSPYFNENKPSILNVGDYIKYTENTDFVNPGNIDTYSLNKYMIENNPIDESLLKKEMPDLFNRKKGDTYQSDREYLSHRLGDSISPLNKRLNKNRNDMVQLKVGYTTINVPKALVDNRLTDEQNYDRIWNSYIDALNIDRKITKTRNNEIVDMDMKRAAVMQMRDAGLATTSSFSAMSLGVPPGALSITGVDIAAKAYAGGYDLYHGTKGFNTHRQFADYAMFMNPLLYGNLKREQMKKDLELANFYDLNDKKRQEILHKSVLKGSLSGLQSQFIESYKGIKQVIPATAMIIRDVGLAEQFYEKVTQHKLNYTERLIGEKLDDTARKLFLDKDRKESIKRGFYVRDDEISPEEAQNYKMIIDKIRKKRGDDFAQFYVFYDTMLDEFKYDSYHPQDIYMLSNTISGVFSLMKTYGSFPVINFLNSKTGQKLAKKHKYLDKLIKSNRLSNILTIGSKWGFPAYTGTKQFLVASEQGQDVDTAIASSLASILQARFDLKALETTFKQEFMSKQKGSTYDKKYPGLRKNINKVMNQWMFYKDPEIIPERLHYVYGTKTDKELEFVLKKNKNRVLTGSASAWIKGMGPKPNDTDFFERTKLVNRATLSLTRPEIKFIDDIKEIQRKFNLYKTDKGVPEPNKKFFQRLDELEFSKQSPYHQAIMRDLRTNFELRYPKKGSESVEKDRFLRKVLEVNRYSESEIKEIMSDDEYKKSMYNSFTSEVKDDAQQKYIDFSEYLKKVAPYPKKVEIETGKLKNYLSKTVADNYIYKLLSKHKTKLMLHGSSLYYKKGKVDRDIIAIDNKAKKWAKSASNDLNKLGMTTKAEKYNGVWQVKDYSKWETSPNGKKYRPQIFEFKNTGNIHWRKGVVLDGVHIVSTDSNMLSKVESFFNKDNMKRWNKDRVAYNHLVSDDMKISEYPVEFNMPEYIRSHGKNLKFKQLLDGFIVKHEIDDNIKEELKELGLKKKDVFDHIYTDKETGKEFGIKVNSPFNANFFKADFYKANDIASIQMRKGETYLKDGRKVESHPAEWDKAFFFRLPVTYTDTKYGRVYHKPFIEQISRKKAGLFGADREKDAEHLKEYIYRSKEYFKNKKNLKPLFKQSYDTYELSKHLVPNKLLKSKKAGLGPGYTGQYSTKYENQRFSIPYKLNGLRGVQDAKAKDASLKEGTIKYYQDKLNKKASYLDRFYDEGKVKYASVYKPSVFQYQGYKEPGDYNEIKKYEPYIPYSEYDKYNKYDDYKEYDDYDDYNKYDDYKPYVPYTPYTAYTPYSPYSSYTGYYPYYPVSSPQETTTGIPVLNKGKVSGKVHTPIIIGKNNKKVETKLYYKTREEAISAGMEIVDKSPYSMFQTEFKDADGKRVLKRYKNFNKKKFKKKGNVYIEKSAYIADKPGEKGGSFDWLSLMNRPRYD